MFVHWFLNVFPSVILSLSSGDVTLVLGLWPCVNPFPLSMRVQRTPGPSCHAKCLRCGLGMLHRFPLVSMLSSQSVRKIIARNVWAWGSCTPSFHYGQHSIYELNFILKFSNLYHILNWVFLSLNIFIELRIKTNSYIPMNTTLLFSKNIFTSKKL